MTRALELRETFSTGESSSSTADDVLLAARGEIAGLLAIAYRRLKAIRCVGCDEPQTLVEKQLANSGVKSVHGVVA